MRQGWEIANLGEVCEMINRGIAPKYIDDGGICVINQKCIRNHTINTALARRHDTAVKPINSERYIQVGDVLINSTGTGTLGRVAQVRKELNEPTTVDTHVTIVRPHSGRFFNDFFGYMLVRIEDEIASSGEGASGQTELARSAIAEKFKVSFPSSISEQELIVSIVDKAFEGIDRAIANTKNNLTNARELLRSYLQSVFTNSDKKWVKTTLGKICQFENGDRGKNYPNREEYVESGIPWINTGHIQPNGTLSQDEMNFITREKFISLRSGKIQPRDLVYCLRGATIGKTAIVDPLTVGAVASSLVIIRPGDLLNSHFLYYFLTSSVGKRLIKLYDNGAAQPNLGAKSVAKYTIFLPTLGEQEIIVQKLVALDEETRRLAAIYHQKLAALTELKQSILQKAFTGELTADTVNQTTKKAEKAIAA